MSKSSPLVSQKPRSKRSMKVVGSLFCDLFVVAISPSLVSIVGIRHCDYGDVLFLLPIVGAGRCRDVDRLRVKG